jgi:hypothetical protein
MVESASSGISWLLAMIILCCVCIGCSLCYTCGGRFYVFGVCVSGIWILNSESDFITDMHKHKQKAESVFNLKGASSAKRMQKLFAVAAIAVLLLMTLSLRVDAQSGEPVFPEYERYVHTDWLGNSTYVEKPMFPVYLNESQVPIGKNWTVVCP